MQELVLTLRHLQRLFVSALHATLFVIFAQYSSLLDFLPSHDDVEAFDDSQLHRLSFLHFSPLVSRAQISATGTVEVVAVVVEVSVSVAVVVLVPVAVVVEVSVSVAVVVVAVSVAVVVVMGAHAPHKIGHFVRVTSPCLHHCDR